MPATDIKRLARQPRPALGASSVYVTDVLWASWDVTEGGDVFEHCLHHCSQRDNEVGHTVIVDIPTTRRSPVAH